MQSIKNSLKEKVLLSNISPPSTDELNDHLALTQTESTEQGILFFLSSFKNQNL